MKNGMYQVNFNVSLTDCETEEDAKQSIAELFQRMVDQVDFSEMTLELIEDEDDDEGYTLEEDNCEELNF